MKRLFARAAPFAVVIALATPGLAWAASKNEFSGIPSPTGQPVPEGLTDLENLCTVEAGHNSCEAPAVTVAGQPKGTPEGVLVAIGRPDLAYMFDKRPNNCGGEAVFLCAAETGGYPVAKTPSVGAMLLIPTGSTVQYGDGTVLPASPYNLGLVVTQLLPDGDFLAAGALANGQDALVTVAATSVPANSGLEFVPYAPIGDKLDVYGDLYAPHTGVGAVDSLLASDLASLGVRKGSDAARRPRRPTKSAS